MNLLNHLIITLVAISEVVQFGIFCFETSISDNIFYNIEWPGKLANIDLAAANEDYVLVTTVNNEQYQCLIPNVESDNIRDHGQSYVGPNELELLKPLFEQKTCSYRIESYWTYELCHGKFLRQYHEEKDPVTKKTKVQEYYLGYFKEANNKGPGDIPESGLDITGTIKARIQKVEGLDIPYFPINMTDGTACDVTGQPRTTHLHYVCQPDGRGEIYELKEMASCVYQVVVLTRVICAHPLYELKSNPVNAIRCHSLEESPQRPLSLVNLELENTRGRYNRKQDTDFDHISFTDQDDEKSASQTLPAKDKTYHQRAKPKQVPPPAGAEIGPQADQQFLNDFLSGDYCIQGGSGWWKHEFCFGKSVTQFHEEREQKKNVIYLGHWDKGAHIEWLKRNPKKKPKDTKKYVIHYYGRGQLCDLTGRPRFVEVKLKCIQNNKTPHAVTIYLTEPNTCEYIMVVESSILCPLIENSDENMLFTNKIP